MLSKTWLIAFFFLLALTPRAFAAGPYIVDDGGVTDPGKLQVESWYSYRPDGDHLLIVNPSYQLLPGAEFSLQYTHAEVDGDHGDILAPQVKYALYDGGEKGMRLAVVARADYAEHAVSGYDAYLPLDVPLGEDTQAHLNLGWQYARGGGGHYVTYGAALEHDLSESVGIIGETFGRNDEAPGFQLGSRLTLPHEVLIDLVYGRRVYSEPGNLFTVGLTVAF